MAGTRKLTIQILGDAKGLAGAFSDAESKVSSFGASIAGIAKTAAVSAAAIGLAAVGLAKPLIGAASDLNESMSKMQQVFGATDAKTIEKWSKTSSIAFGQSQQAAIDSAAGFAGLGKAAGLQGRELAGFSTKLTELASDLASFGNTSPEEAVLALGSGLRGEAEPLRRYNILLDDATLRQKAMALGITKSTKDALTPQQKTLASYAVILEQTKDAQGDFARTSGGLANQQRILAAQFQNAKAQLGQALLPAATVAVRFFTGTFMPGIQRVIDLFRSEGWRGALRTLGDQLRAELPAIKTKLAEWGGALVDWVKAAVPPALKALGGFVADVAQYVVDHAEDWAGKLATWGQRLWGWIEPQIVPTLRELGKVVAKIGEWIITDGGPKVKKATETLAIAFTFWANDVGGKIITNLGTELAKLATWINEESPKVIRASAERFGERLVEYVINGIRNAPKSIAAELIDQVPFAAGLFGSGNLAGKAVDAAGDTLPPKKKTVREILDDAATQGDNGLNAFGGSFALGGVVPGRRGEPKLILAHAGETVVPTHLDGVPAVARGGAGAAMETVTVPVVVNIGGERIDTVMVQIARRADQNGGWRVKVAS